MNYSMNTFKISSFKLIMVICLFVSSLSYAQTIQTSNIGMLSFEAKEIDYGSINQHDNGERIFKFTNSGNAPVVISQVKTTCGCTVPKYPKTAILPGDSGEIKIKYATNRVGAFSKGITVHSNAKNAKQTLKIKGTVLKSAI